MTATIPGYKFFQGLTQVFSNFRIFCLFLLGALPTRGLAVGWAKRSVPNKPFPATAISIVLATFTCAPALAADAAERLQTHLKNVQSLTADFEQIVFDQERAEVQRSSGRLRLHRPARFRWDYRTPYKQLILSDGETVWIYDEELEQVTVKPLDRAVARTPAMVLSSGDAVDRHYEVTDLGEREGLDWLRLVPKASDTDYEHVRLGFGGDALRVMELEDGFGQITRLNFSDIDANAAIDPMWFRFEPPPGVDVIEGH